jgi:hypothetical protein
MTRRSDSALLSPLRQARASERLTQARQTGISMTLRCVAYDSTKARCSLSLAMQSPMPRGLRAVPQAAPRAVATMHHCPYLVVTLVRRARVLGGRTRYAFGADTEDKRQFFSLFRPKLAAKGISKNAGST